jgi:LacI family transcriptional regulator
MAREAVQSLVRRVRALREGADAPPERVGMAFELVRRQSDAAPRVRPPARLPSVKGAVKSTAKSGAARRAHAAG